MNFLVFQHVAVEHPGIFCDFMIKDGIKWHTVELDEGDSIPDLRAYDALIVMGGPMDVWQEDKYPWLISEKQAIQQAICDLNLPYLGFCLGHQLMADALGGRVGKMLTPEVGIFDVELTPAGLESALFRAAKQNIKSLQWHGAEVTQAPPNSLTLARSPLCSIQALQYGKLAFSMQYHIELIDSTVSSWGEIPEYEQSLEETLGVGSLKKLDIEVKKHMLDFNHSAHLIYNNFISQIKAHT